MVYKVLLGELALALSSHNTRSAVVLGGHHFTDEEAEHQGSYLLRATR